MAVHVCPICGERATWRAEHSLLADVPGLTLDCPSRHAASTPPADWHRANAARLAVEIDAFLHPRDDVVDHAHRWEFSEAAADMVLWECLDCSAWATSR